MNVFSTAVNSSSLAKYRRYVSDDLAPRYRDSEIAVLGINTAHAWTVKSGRVGERQIDAIRECLGSSAHGIVKILVTHHPLELTEEVGRTRQILAALAHCRIDVLLAGHLHLSSGRAYRRALSCGGI